MRLCWVAPCVEIRCGTGERWSSSLVPFSGDMILEEANLFMQGFLLFVLLKPSLVNYSLSVSAGN